MRSPPIEMAFEQPLLRVLGVVLSLYADHGGLDRTDIGTPLVPRLAVFPHHGLVTHSALRWIRHPLYSGASALWFGAALGTLNWILLVLWPLLVTGHGFDYAFFGLVASGWSIDEFGEPGASKRLPPEARWAEILVGILDRERAAGRVCPATESE